MVLRPEAKSADHEAIGDAVIAHCRARIAGYKAPREIVILDELPPPGRPLEKFARIVCASRPGQIRKHASTKD